MTPQPAPAPGQLAGQLTAGLDGPHADDRTTGAAALASESIRFLNYATGPHATAGLTYPATVYTVTGSLSDAAGRLPQLFGQLTGWLDSECAAGRLGDDHGGPVAVLTDRARYYLDQAARHAGDLGEALAAAQSALATVHSKRGGGVVNIRIIARPADAAAVAKVLGTVLPVITVRGPYPCRGDDQQVRLYLEVQP